MNGTAIALLIAPMPAGARSAPHANSVNGIAELIAAMPVSFSHNAPVNCLRARQRNGSRMSAPKARRISTRAYGPKSFAATRMNRNDAPQIAPSTVSSTGVSQELIATDDEGALLAGAALEVDMPEGF